MGCVPEMTINEYDWEMVARINQELVDYINLLEDAREREAITVVFNISRLGNQIMQHNTPWKLVKGSEDDKKRAGSVVGLCQYLLSSVSPDPAILAKLLKVFANPIGCSSISQCNT